MVDSTNGQAIPYLPKCISTLRYSVMGLTRIERFNVLREYTCTTPWSGLEIVGSLILRLQTVHMEIECIPVGNISLVERKCKNYLLAVLIIGYEHIFANSFHTIFSAFQDFVACLNTLIVILVSPITEYLRVEIHFGK